MADAIFPLADAIFPLADAIFPLEYLACSHLPGIEAKVVLLDVSPSCMCLVCSRIRCIWTELLLYVPDILNLHTKLL